MKATIELKFLEIMGLKVDDQMLKKAPTLVHSTNTTLMALCGVIEKYFKDKRIKVIAHGVVDGKS